MNELNETVLLTYTRNTKTENKHPQNPGGKRLPKYDSQSETTNDTMPLIENHTRPNSKTNIEKLT